MLTINSIKKGLVIDHIKAGTGIKIFHHLGLDRADCTVALIMNVPSQKMGKKDIIKIEDVIDIDFAKLGLVDPTITIDVIENEVITEKKKLALPKRAVNIIKCKNPRCVTSIEKVDHEFVLVDEAKGEYRCIFCDETYRVGDM